MWTWMVSGPQSALDPGGPHASSIATLSWIMFAGGGVIFLIVMLLLGWALIVPGRRSAWLSNIYVVMVGGIAFPIVTLSALLIYGLSIARTITAMPDEAPLEISVVGEQFWWRVHYLENGKPAFETANDIHIPVGQPVRLSLTTADVIHSFWVPSLAGKLDMIPGQTNVLTLKPDRLGVYRGQCAEFCGGAHALMAFDVVALAQDQFDAWRNGQSRAAREPTDPFLRRGKKLFLAAGCGSCHTVRGTSADGTIGPDLTHVGSRRSIAAGTLPNNRGTLGGWISDSQHLKPGNKMPPFDMLSGQDLLAVTSYLESLK